MGFDKFSNTVFWVNYILYMRKIIRFNNTHFRLIQCTYSYQIRR